MTPPTITISTDFESGLHTLRAESYGFTAAAGPRLFRKQPHPNIRFQHDDLNLAQADAKTLQAYIDEAWGAKIGKDKLRKQENTVAPDVVPVWEVFKDEQTTAAAGDEW